MRPAPRNKERDANFAAIETHADFVRAIELRTGPELNFKPPGNKAQRRIALREQFERSFLGRPDLSQSSSRFSTCSYRANFVRGADPAQMIRMRVGGRLHEQEINDVVSNHGRTAVS